MYPVKDLVFVIQQYCLFGGKEAVVVKSALPNITQNEIKDSNHIIWRK